MSIGIIALILFIAMGLAMEIMPEKLIKVDMRVDPDAIEHTKKTGKAILGFAGMAALLLLKYKLF